MQRSAIVLSSYFVVSKPVNVTYNVIGDPNPSDSVAGTVNPRISDDPGFYDTLVVSPPQTVAKLV